MSATESLASMTPDELIAVIERGLEADEHAARAWLPFGNPDSAARAHVARHDPARVLADVESKRKIVAECKATLDYAEGMSDLDHYGALGLAEETLVALARPYLDRERS